MTYRTIKAWLVMIFLAILASTALGREKIPIDTVYLKQLPAEARHTLNLVKNGGPFPYAKDGRVFGNYERVLPEKKRGYYHEFTVETPGAEGRGARRIVAGGQPVFSVFYYTGDHYRTFKRIVE